ncbi:cellulase family glycosylhydrolase [Micromonospora thermarum]|uniref:Cellulase family glycosylhydrolase n=1 Tax=Micromonospora thermarum TaxID=2720024 RepID=A0ABX0ZEA3_9ACTN|nr:cellulase family glycosylhydrolase [Micromonospora thermarum]NJP35388.1 cellulase family glycosylhydrolase [Micromonospora thermarum]
MNNFLRAVDGQIHDSHGRPVLLRGVGLGNWLLAEGYMWKFEPPGPQSPREIEALVTDLVGAERATQFWAGFRERFITDADLARIAAEGMNHVRLPINSRVVMTEGGELDLDGIALVDWLIDRCRVHGLWVVLDLHGAPGGQTGTNIDDSPNGRPELFTERRYQEQTIALWQALAARYRDEPVVAGYDLLNEPLPNEYQDRYATELVGLYRELTDAIRAVDPHHLIIYEGTHWASNWDIFTEVWDPQSVLQFHRYWSPPDRPGIQRFLDVRQRLNLPIYMGEGGENNLDWLQTAFQLYEDEDISWNFWPWKKIDTLTSPCSVVAPAGWSEVMDYAAGKADRPDPDHAWQTLRDLLDSFDLSACVYRAEVVNALLRRPPLRLPATGFSFRGEGESYRTSEATPLAGFRPDDQVTIVRSPQAEDRPLNFSHTDGSPRASDDQLLVRLQPGDWVSYDVHLVAPTRLRITVPVAAGLELRLDGEPLALHGGTGTSPEAVPTGRHTIQLTATADVLLDGLQVTPAG